MFQRTRLIKILMETQVHFIRARAIITENELKDTPPGFNLMPGMTVSGKFRVGKRRLITYFIYPLIRTLGNSFAEP